MVSKALVVATYRSKLRELARLGIELTAVVPESWHEGGRKMAIEAEDDTEYHLVTLPLRWNGHFHLHSYPGLHRTLTCLRPDIVHVDEEPYNLASFLAVRDAAKAQAHPVFFTWQNIKRRYPPPFRSFERRVYQHCSHAIAGNSEAADVLRAKGYAGEVSVIPQFGIDPERFAPCQPDDGPFTVGYVGRLVREKGIHDLVAAFAGLPEPSRLLLVGDGPERERIEAQVQTLGLIGRVEVRQRVRSTDVPGLLRRLHALVLPSHTTHRWKEQFGRVLIEAMASGVPVVGSDSGEIPHVIGDAGIVFAEKHVALLGDALRALHDDTALWTDLRRRGRERVLAHFTQQHIAQQTYDVYADMLNTRSDLHHR